MSDVITVHTAEPYGCKSYHSKPKRFAKVDILCCCEYPSKYERCYKQQEK